MKRRRCNLLPDDSDDDIDEHRAGFIENAAAAHGPSFPASAVPQDSSSVTYDEDIGHYVEYMNQKHDEHFGEEEQAMPVPPQEVARAVLPEYVLSQDSIISVTDSEDGAPAKSAAVATSQFSHLWPDPCPNLPFARPVQLLVALCASHREIVHIAYSSQFGGACEPVPRTHTGYTPGGGGASFPTYRVTGGKGSGGKGMAMPSQGSLSGPSSRKSGKVQSGGPRPKKRARGQAQAVGGAPTVPNMPPPVSQPNAHAQGTGHRSALAPAASAARVGAGVSYGNDARRGRVEGAVIGPTLLARPPPGPGPQASTVHTGVGAGTLPLRYGGDPYAKAQAAKAKAMQGISEARARTGAAGASSQAFNSLLPGIARQGGVPRPAIRLPSHSAGLGGGGGGGYSVIEDGGGLGGWGQAAGLALPGQGRAGHPKEEW